eukprot:c8627_g1_i1.p1 GENE.c8627_g1_i1~~c8627_g1_i1.p1  ORF type:complete len:674 (+),score=182.36 c8627_g1_i1:50-2071(+)
MLVVPKIAVPQSKLDKLADDLKKLEIQTVVKVGEAPVPAFQRQGYLEKLGHNKSKWFKRFFVLRDSFLLSYNLQKSDFTVEPRGAVHLGGANIQLVEESNGKNFCFVITTMQKDVFVLAAESDTERQAWVCDIDEARKVTHANMIKLSVENQCLAEEKGASAVARDNSTSALALFSNQEYIRSTPLTGGAEGWLRTKGFNPDEQKSGLLKSKPSFTKCYFILRDSHLLMFHGGDVLTKPRGCMYLLGTTVIVGEDVEGEGFPFTVKSTQCGDEIGLLASSHKVRARWIQALQVGARVTYPDYQLLLKEHALLSAVTMTPRAAPPKAANMPAERLELPPPPLHVEDFDLQGQQLDPGAMQPFDSEGNPILRNPEGKLVDANGEALSATQPRFGPSGEQLDPFNRPLPPGAVPMFTQDAQPIGVGPDGLHYLPDGTQVDESAPHFDVSGNQLPQEVVVAANAISTNLNVAIKVRQVLRGDDSMPEVVDVLGRTFREMNDKKSQEGVLLNADGDLVPLQSARRVETGTGKLVDYASTQLPRSTDTTHLIIKVDNEGDEQQIGEVEIDSHTTLKDVRELIVKEIEVSFPDFVFLFNQVPLMKYEEKDRLALSCLPEVVVRGKELKSVTPSGVFSKKVTSLTAYEEQKKKEQQDFDSIMAQVRQGRFLRSAKQSILEP